MGLVRQVIYEDCVMHVKLPPPIQLGDMLALDDWSLVVVGVKGATGRVLVCLREDGEVISIWRSIFYDEPDQIIDRGSSACAQRSVVQSDHTPHRS